MDRVALGTTEETLPLDVALVIRLERENVRERPGIDALRIAVPETGAVLDPENPLAVPVRTPVEERKPEATEPERMPLAEADATVRVGAVRSRRTGREPTTVRAAVDRVPEAAEVTVREVPAPVTVLGDTDPTADPTPLLGEMARGEEGEAVEVPERHGEIVAERVPAVEFTDPPPPAGAVRRIDPALGVAEDPAAGPMDLVAGAMARGDVAP
jgi:hypothetical protein